MSAIHPDQPQAITNDLFRRAIGKRADASGVVIFDPALTTLPMRKRRVIVTAVRSYTFTRDDGDQYSLRETAILFIDGARYRFTVELDDTSQRPSVLRIALA